LVHAQNFAGNDYAKGKVQEAVDHLDKGIVDALAFKYLEDVQYGRSVEENWGTNRPHYKESKLFLNTYTRILAGEQLARPEGERILVNGFCPGAVLTDLAKEAIAKLEPAVAEQMAGQLGGFDTPTEGAVPPVWIALLPKEEFPHGKFFVRKQESVW
jgi:NAD(P)-dependent dehydrogenase (short-subunit alcohol dehydrogenase family)